MGLTITYKLTGKGSLTSDEVRNMVRRTARYARKIGCAHVGKVLYATDSDPDAPEFFQSRVGNERRLVGGGDTHGWLVEVWPGDRCETAVFGLLRNWRRFPSTPCRRPPRVNARWKLYDWCKTGHAVWHGTEHFVRCHVRVIQLLDFWRAMGAEVEVLDDGGYWKARAESELGAQVRGMQEFFRRMGDTTIVMV